MTPEQLLKLKKTKRIANHDTYLRKMALKQGRFLLTSNVLQGYSYMQKMHIEKHNELYRKILNDPLYDVRCFLPHKQRES